MPYTNGTVMFLVALAQIIILVWFIRTLSSINSKLGELVDAVKLQGGSMINSHQRSRFDDRFFTTPQPSAKPEPAKDES